MEDKTYYQGLAFASDVALKVANEHLQEAEKHRGKLFGFGKFIQAMERNKVALEVSSLIIKEINADLDRRRAALKAKGGSEVATENDACDLG